MVRFFSITYKRPKHVDQESFRQAVRTSTNSDQTDDSNYSGSTGSSASIPDALSFDNVVNGGACPVSSTVVMSPALRPFVLMFS